MELSLRRMPVGMSGAVAGLTDADLTALAHFAASR